jgi:GNAT superfamily N-acetyltransferase
VFEVCVRDVHFDHPVVQGLFAEWIDELGFSLKGDSTVEASDFTPPHGVFLLAVSGETPVGCGGVRRLTPTSGEVKRLFMRRTARGRGVGRALLAGLEDRAWTAALPLWRSPAGDRNSGMRRRRASSTVR